MVRAILAGHKTRLGGWSRSATRSRNATTARGGRTSRRGRTATMEAVGVVPVRRARQSPVGARDVALCRLDRGRPAVDPVRRGRCAPPVRARDARVGARVADIWAELSSAENVAVDGRAADRKWRPSIFLPAGPRASPLAVTSVRVERLQEISEDDAQAEGVDRYAAACDHRGSAATRSAVRSDSSRVVRRALGRHQRRPGGLGEQPVGVVVERARHRRNHRTMSDDTGIEGPTRRGTRSAAARVYPRAAATMTPSAWRRGSQAGQPCTRGWCASAPPTSRLGWNGTVHGPEHLADALAPARRVRQLDERPVPRQLRCLTPRSTACLR